MKTAIINMQIIVMHGKYSNKLTKDYTLIVMEGRNKREIPLIKNGKLLKSNKTEFYEWQLLQMQDLKQLQK